MKKYVALWHIGNVSRGEVISLGDEEAKRLLSKGAIEPFTIRIPVTGDETKKETEPESQEPEGNPEMESAAEPGDEPEDEAPETEQEEAEAQIEIDPMDAIGETETEPAKPARKSRKKVAE